MSTPYQLLRPLLFRLPPERAHQFTLTLLRLAGASALTRDALRALLGTAPATAPVSAFGLTFANPLGLAAGYDKDGLGWRGLAELGFGHLELGTVTLQPQPGNPGPRVFRLPEDAALINRMGFPSRGAAFLAQRLPPRPARAGGPIIGVNIGKNKATSLERAADDYVTLLDLFAPRADYLTINVSSPNTPGLRSLQTGAALAALLQPVAAARAAQVEQLARPVPVLVKLAPDLEDAELDAALEVILAARLDGVIIGNTTLRRSGLRSAHAQEAGGLSGRPLGELNMALLTRVVRRVEGGIPVIASGGVMTPADYRARLDAGATLVQLYTGLIYSGPGLVRACLAG